MKTYLAIGHFRDEDNTRCVALKTTTRKNFVDNLGGNAFVPYAIISEKKLAVLEKLVKEDDPFGLFEEVKKLTSNYRKWNELCDYIEQCVDIMRFKYITEKNRID